MPGEREIPQMAIKPILVNALPDRAFRVLVPILMHRLDAMVSALGRYAMRRQHRLTRFRCR